MSATICQGDTFLGKFSTGIYIDTIFSLDDCDTVRRLDLVVRPLIDSTIYQSICRDQSYLGHNTTGTYIDTLYGTNGCDTLRTLHLKVSDHPNPDLGINKLLCIGDNIILSPGNFTSYLWQDSSTLNYFIVTRPGAYSVIVTNSCGSKSDKIMIFEKPCREFFPNVFTPNKDGKNDFFKILKAFGLKEYKLTIYNRWGQKIFETTEYTKGWDGSFNGHLQSPGVYIYKCMYKKTSEIHKKGTFILIR